ncbi:hypothetical protein HZ326_24298 [Fusarium oxysporum f. sp. albedinis]|nr:hypothetical protein HZ326_24298 [Fusarium oxysporum f. sp. albedinis]
MKVAIIGATGQTGSVIVQALLESTVSTFEVVALTRPSSLQKPGILELQEQGVKVVSLPQWLPLKGRFFNLPKLLSGRINYTVIEIADRITRDGIMLFALTDIQDIGRYMAQIITDSRTLNQIVFAYNEIWTQNQIYDLLEKLSGERLDCKYVPAEAIKASIAKIESTAPSPDSVEFITLAQYQYWYSCCIRGDNTPEYATFLGYLNT